MRHLIICTLKWAVLGLSIKLGQKEGIMDPLALALALTLALAMAYVYNYNPVHFSVHIIRWRVTVIIHIQYMYCTTRLIHFKIVAYCCALAPWLSSRTVVMPSLTRSGLG